MSEPSLKGYCPTCSAERFADAVAVHEERWDEGPFSYCRRHSILKCRGCQTVYVERADSCDDDVEYLHDETGEVETFYPERKSYWPAPTQRAAPSWIHVLESDPDLKALYDELYAALNGDLRVLAAIGVRTVFDRVSESLGVDPALPFDKKLADLKAKGKIGGDELALLDILTNAGNAAAHRGWRPSPQDLETLVATLEAFLYRTLVLDNEVKALGQGVPRKPKPRPKPAAPAPAASS
jgi:hypothetical protein